MADLIDRQAAIDALDKRFDDVPMELTTEILQLRHDLRERIPSAQPATSCSEIPNSSDDTISRQAAIDAVIDELKRSPTPAIRAKFRLEALPSAQPEKQHGRIFQEIVVKYPSYNPYPERKGKPYFSIKYTENGQEFIGYGTYKPEVLSEYLKEYFMPSAQPDIIRCKDCKYWREHKYAKETKRYIPFCGFSAIYTQADDYCSKAERR